MKKIIIVVIFLVLANFVYSQNLSSEQLAIVLALQATREFDPREFVLNTEVTFALFRVPLEPRGGNYYIVNYTWDNVNDRPIYGSSATKIELFNNDIVPLFRIISAIEYNTLVGRLNGQVLGSFKFWSIYDRNDNVVLIACLITFNNVASKIIFEMDTGLW